MFRFLRSMFGAGKARAFQPIGNTGPNWGSLGQPNVTDPGFALNLSSVAACIGLISGTLAALPAIVYRRNNDGTRAEAPTHPLARIIRDGSGGWTWSDIVGAWIADAALMGNGLLHLQTDTTGRLAGLQWLPFARTSVRLLASGKVVYEYSDPAGKMRRFLADEIVHLRDRLDPAAPFLGKSRLAQSPGVISLANTLSATQQSFTGNLSRPGGVLTAPQKVSDETAKRLREDWNANFSGPRAGKTAVLGEGLEWKAITTADAQAAQLTEQLRWSLQEVARLWNISPAIVGDLSESSFMNSAQAARSLATFTLMPWAQKIEAAFRHSVLFAPFEMAIDLTELLKGDVEAYSKALVALRTSAIFSANECRVLLNMDRHSDPDADKLQAVQHGQDSETQPAKPDDAAGGDPGRPPAKGLRAVS